MVRVVICHRANNFNLFTAGNFAEKRVLKLVFPKSRLHVVHFSASVPGAKYEFPKFEHALFLLSLSPLLWLFLLRFFSFVGHLLGFRIIGLDGRKCRRVAEQDFHRNFRVNFSCFFFAFFLLPPWLNPAYSGMVWKISSHCTNKARFRRRTFHERNLIRIRADPNYLDRLNWFRRRAKFKRRKMLML